ncbi:MAG: SMP-30/gluconolactonase/LRE family protein [Comamonadaceae bacterium]|nr:SMP-30/gluconolactonase/LRE family protein [Comamonadaceae bacterium]
MLVIDFGNKNVLRVDPLTGNAEIFATIPGGAAAGPNALAFDGNGNVYISDSFQGTIWRKPLDGDDPLVAWVSHPLLTTTGVPPFGANGIAFNNAATALFVANTGNDSIVEDSPARRSGRDPGTPEVFVNSINGADGLIVDEDDNLWVAANQADEIVVLDRERTRHRQARRFRRHRPRRPRPEDCSSPPAWCGSAASYTSPTSPSTCAASAWPRPWIPNGRRR